MLSFKHDVKLDVLDPRIVLGVLCVYSVFEEFGYDCVITSISDGVHRSDSFHYRGCAADFRIRHINGPAIDAVVNNLRQALGSNFDVVLEVDHLHVEYDPK